MSFSNGSIRIKVKTWKKDSYGLYDYETSNYVSQNLEISRSGKLIRSNNELNYMLPSRIEDSEGQDDTNQEVIAHISEGSEGIKIVPNSLENSESNQLWRSVERSEESEGHLCKEDDTIKLGRVIFKIKQIKWPDSSTQPPEDTILNSIKEYIENNESILPSKEQTKQNDENSSAACCKICLGDKAETDDPLISPCKCIGSVKFVHLKCLQNWVKSKLDMEEDQKIISIFWTMLSCELCKAKLPLYFNHQGKDLLLFPFEAKMTGPYLILESFSKEKDPAGIHIIDLSQKDSFRIGRGHDCDLKLSDVSVSRIHSVLNIKEGKLYLKDNYSKFGTLILVKEPIVLDDQNSRSSWIQYGKTVLRFTLRRPWNTMIPYLPLIPKGRLSKPDHVLIGGTGEKPQERLSTNYGDVSRDGNVSNEENR